MGRKYAIRNQRQLYFVTFTVVYWIDVFVRKRYVDILIDSLIFCQNNKGLEIWGYCIMPSHVHLIIGTDGTYKLEDIIRDFKRHTSLEIRKSIEDKSFPESRREWMLWMMKRAGSRSSRNTVFQFWQQDNHPIELDDVRKTDQRLDYIHNNPVEMGLVADPNHWLYSSASYYNLNTDPIFPIRNLYA
jgi:REP element-mobilizing transposase RayT